MHAAPSKLTHRMVGLVADGGKVQIDRMCYVCRMPHIVTAVVHIRPEGSLRRR